MATALAFSPDGLRLAGGSRGGDLYLWGANATAGPILQTQPGSGGRTISAIAWYPDSARLATGSDDSHIRFWNIKGQNGPVLTLHPDADTAFVTLSSDGETLIAASRYGHVRAFRTRTFETAWVAFVTGLQQVTLFTPSGRLLQHSPAALKHFVYLCERPDRGVDLLTHDQFQKRKASLDSPP